MLNAFSRFFVVLVLGVAAAVPSSSQSAQQTPANAQLFLSTVTGQYPVHAYPGLNVALPYTIFRLDDWVGESECQSRLVGSIHYISAADGEGPFSFGVPPYPAASVNDLARFKKALEISSVKGFPYTLDWSKVMSVKQSMRHKTEAVTNLGNFQTKSVVQLVAADADFAFSFPNEELATRVAFAMEYLRMHCDKTAQTGF
jgi:hypothetical protein